MKAITIKQPYAHLICCGIKDIENRTWKTNYRGMVLIHASATDDVNKVHGIYNLLTYGQINQLNKLVNEELFKNQLPHSAIIGSVEIVDCVRNSQSIWAINGNWHWILRNPVIFEKPIENIKGKLSFWDYNEKI